MSFAQPVFLLLIAFPVALALAVYRSFTRRSKAAVKFAQTDLLADIAPQHSWRRFVPPALLLAALSMLVIGFARPERETEVARETRQVVLAFDVSYSMQAEDVPPNRLVVAQQAAKDFVEASPDDVQVGFVQFAGTIIDIIAPTDNKQQILTAIDNVSLRPGTAIGDAIATSLELLPANTDSASDISTGSIVVMSDGISTTGIYDEDAVALANEQNVSISTISFGTQEGFIISEGEQVPVPSAPESLAAIAEMTGGLTAAAENAEQLYEIFDAIQASIAPEMVTQDLSVVAFAAAFLLLVVGFSLSLLWFTKLS